MGDQPRMLRRSFLAGVGVTALAGCIGDITDDFEYISAPDVEFEFSGSNADGIVIRQVAGDEFEGQFAAIEGDAAFGATPRNLSQRDDWPDVWSPTTEIEIGGFSIQTGTLEIVWRGDEEPSVLATWEVPFD